jgi:aspartyl-tRNA(Asn)/glutamyl-tRNA(Gln) amidotransferase subunit A
VAAGLAYAALGTDTGCSVRQPAHCCGITGHKPSYGLISKHGVTPLVWTLDHVGVLARSVDDAKLLTSTIAGFDPRDPDSRELRTNAADNARADLSGLTIGVPRPYFFEGGDPEIVATVDAALEQLQAQGARLLDVDVPDPGAALEIAVACFAEVVSAHGEAWRARPDALSPRIRSSFESFATRLASDYASARHRGRLFRRQMSELMSTVDLLAMPTSTVAAGPIANQPASNARERWKNCVIFNLSGQPSASIPCGFTSSGLPVGLMLSAEIGDDNTLLRVASGYQRATDWHRRHPPDRL